MLLRAWTGGDGQALEDSSQLSMQNSAVSHTTI